MIWRKEMYDLGLRRQLHMIVVDSHSHDHSDGNGDCAGGSYRDTATVGPDKRVAPDK